MHCEQSLVDPAGLGLPEQCQYLQNPGRAPPMKAPEAIHLRGTGNRAKVGPPGAWFLLPGIVMLTAVSVRGVDVSSFLHFAGPRLDLAAVARLVAFKIIAPLLVGDCSVVLFAVLAVQRYQSRPMSTSTAMLMSWHIQFRAIRGSTPTCRSLRRCGAPQAVPAVPTGAGNCHPRPAASRRSPSCCWMSTCPRNSPMAILSPSASQARWPRCPAGA